MDANRIRWSHLTCASPQILTILFLLLLILLLVLLLILILLSLLAVTWSRLICAIRVIRVVLPEKNSAHSPGCGNI